jgi:hypothetical protein
MAKAIIRSKEVNGKSQEVLLRIPTPSGTYLALSWNKANQFTLEVATSATYVNTFGKVLPLVINDKTGSTNVAQHVLDSYGDILELVDIKEDPVVEAPAVVERKRKKEKES